jgi:PAS domain S-box-containing protein
MTKRNEEESLRAVAMETSRSILAARQRAEHELVEAKRALEARTEQLAQSLAMMRATLDSTTDGILVVDGSGALTDYNEQFAAMWRMPSEALASGDRDTLLQVAVQQLKNPEQFLARTQEIYATSPHESIDVLEFGDGRVFERLSKIQRIDQRIVGRVWSYRDITERVRAEETLRDEARVLELLNKTGAAIAAQLDLQSLVQIVTDAATELTGAKFGSFFYTIQDESGEALMLYTLSGAPREAFEKFGHPRATGLFGPTFRGEGPIRSGDILQDPRYGQWGPHHGMPKGHLPVRSYLAMPVISRSGEVIGGLFFGHPEVGVFTERAERIVVGVAAQAAIAIDNARLYDAAQRQIAQRKQAEAERERLFVSEKEARERAERETRMKDEFLATLSHELRTPLNAILGWANILRTSATPEDIAEGVEVIERNARAQTQIIEDLLDMSRIVSGNVRLDVQRIDLVPVMKSAIESVKPMAAAREIRLTSVLDPLAGPVAGDPARLQQVLFNLLTNALKFTQKGGRVQVVLERVNSHVEISVDDTGQGIAPDFLPHVFDRFRQADASSTRAHRGLGLGLAIVKNLVELHGGSVRAKSPGQGMGATFSILLPVAIARIEGDAERRHPVRAADTAAADVDCDLEGVRVLAIDDEADARHLVMRILSACGATVETAASADEALTMLKDSKPDVLISDIGMPGEDGYAAIRRIRQLGAEAGGDIPAIALTAFARSEDRTRAILSGFQMHMAKPIEPSELIAMVASLAKRTT